MNRLRRDISFGQYNFEPSVVDPGQFKSAWPPVTLPVEDVGLIGSSLDRPVEPAVLEKAMSYANTTKKSLANIIGRPTDLNESSIGYVPFVIGGLVLLAWWMK